MAQLLQARATPICKSCHFNTFPHTTHYRQLLPLQHFTSFLAIYQPLCYCIIRYHAEYTPKPATGDEVGSPLEPTIKILPLSSSCPSMFSLPNPNTLELVKLHSALPPSLYIKTVFH